MFLAYLRAGLSVIPIATDGSKAPVLAWRGYQKEQATEAEATEWSRRGHGVGLVCGFAGVEVIDIDAPELVKLFAESIPDDLAAKICWVRTPRGDAEGRRGAHLIYRTASPEGNQKLATGVRDGKGLTLIETRGTGGYVVTVGSPAACHASGNLYEHVAGPDLLHLETITEDERAILFRVARSFSQQAEFADVGGHGGNGAPGADRPGDEFERTASWESILTPAGWTAVRRSGEFTYWRRPGKDVGWSATTGARSKSGRDLFCVFSSNASPFDGPTAGGVCSTHTKFDCLARISFGGDHRQAAASLRGPESINAIAVANIVGQCSAALSPVAPRNPRALPAELYEVPGVIQNMIAFHRERAPRPRPELSLVATIALLGAVTGRKIQTKSGMRTNIYCVGLAPSGSGKDKPRHDTRAAMQAAGLDQELLGSENPASDAALIQELAEKPALLLQIDEVSRYFASIKNAGNNSTHLKNIFTRFLELTGQSENPAWRPKGYADKKKSLVVVYPHLCIYGTATADGFWASVQSSDAVDGFLARMMVVEASSDYPRLQDTEIGDVPSDVTEILRAWRRFAPGPGNLAVAIPSPLIVPIESAAEDRLRSHSDGIEDRLADEPDDQKSIWSRASALAKKLSLIFAASRGPDGVVVSLADAEAAVKLANWSTRLLINRVFLNVSENESESRKKRVLAILRKTGGMSLNELTRKTQWLRDARERLAILAELADAEFIVFEKKSPLEGGGRPATYVRVSF